MGHVQSVLDFIKSCRWVNSLRIYLGLGPNVFMNIIEFKQNVNDYIFIQVIIYRTAFDEIQRSTVLIWFALDYFADFIYLMDILIHFRTGTNGSNDIESALNKHQICPRFLLMTSIEENTKLKNSILSRLWRTYFPLKLYLIYCFYFISFKGVVIFHPPEYIETLILTTFFNCGFATLETFD